MVEQFKNGAGALIVLCESIGLYPPRIKHRESGKGQGGSAADTRVSTDDDSTPLETTAPHWSASIRYPLLWDRSSVARELLRPKNLSLSNWRTLNEILNFL